MDVDTIYHGFDRVLPHVDYLVASSEFPARWTSERDPFRALAMIQDEYGMRVAAMTLGARRRTGARRKAASSIRPASWSTASIPPALATCFTVRSVMLCSQNMPLGDALEFSNAMAALNCTALGARGRHRHPAKRAQALMRGGERRSEPDFEQCI